MDQLLAPIQDAFEGQIVRVFRSYLADKLSRACVLN